MPKGGVPFKSDADGPKQGLSISQGMIPWYGMLEGHFFLAGGFRACRLVLVAAECLTRLFLLVASAQWLKTGVH